MMIDWDGVGVGDGDGEGTNALVIVGSNYRLTLCGSGAEAAEVVARRWAHNFRAWSKGSPISRPFWIGVGGVGAAGSGEVGQRLCRLWTKINKIARRRSKRWSSSALNCCCWFRIEGVEEEEEGGGGGSGSGSGGVSWRDKCTVCRILISFDLFDFCLFGLFSSDKTKLNIHEREPRKSERERERERERRGSPTEIPRRNIWSGLEPLNTNYAAKCRNELKRWKRSMKNPKRATDLFRSPVPIHGKAAARARVRSSMKWQNVSVSYRYTE